ncbi:MAG: hypothetical protein JSR53_16005 [Proteobacteria bacterium]|nr:hypothetical protein [Pseudomonadota bacterium]
MITSASIELYTEHRGLARIQGAMDYLRQTGARLAGARGASSMLLTAAVAALMVAANELIDSWSDGHLLAAWMVLWGIAFAGMALLAVPARNAVALVRSGAKAWAEARRHAAEDEKTWNAALHDARLMADLSRAMNGIAVEDMRRYR